MATLVLGTVGRVFGGTLVGGIVDRGVFGGGGKTREGPRLANLAVQSAAYGEPLPRVYGRMRVAGNLVWTAGIKETRSRSGGGKSGPATSSYSYSASFAVIVAARTIVGVERIWADGKLLRAADGTLNFPATIRTYRGDEAQVVDPLIAAAEGNSAPAYRGSAYLVFEDLPLADYGNRIPNLTFEIVADADPIGLNDIARDVAGVDGSGAFPAIAGFAAAQAGSVRQLLAGLGDVGDLAVHDTGTRLAIGTGAVATIAARETGASDRDRPTAESRETRNPDVADAVWLTYADPARDYSAGVQAAVRRSPTLRIDRREPAIACSATDARRIADDLMRRAVAARTTGRLSTSWRHAAIRPGDIVVIGDAGTAWRVTHRTITGAVIDFDLDRVPLPVGVGAAVDGGRIYAGGDAPQGATVLHVLDLPGLSGPLATTPRLLLAAAGSGRWRRADVTVSRDGGASFVTAATIPAPATIGTVVVALPAGTVSSWDRRNTIEVELADLRDDLQSASEAAVLAGANLAVVGDEILQFAEVEHIAPRRFRLKILLRGRRGTEAAVTGHVTGDRFVLLDERVIAFDPAIEAIGAPLVFKAVGPADDSAAIAGEVITLRGVALRPLSPAHLSARRDDGDLIVTWRRRSRAGFVWSDGTDAPLGEDSEQYRVTVRHGSSFAVTAIVSEPSWRIALPAAGLGTTTVAVAQISATVGAGPETSITF